jgi:prepilin-type N-terminal cleavage/methylation domain-containing protein
MYPREAGFTLVEMLVSIVLVAIIGVTFLVFFKSALFSYLNLQADATSLTQLSSQEMRVATVLRGLTNINSASANDLSIYSYFYPSDTYVSLVHYYLHQTGTDKQLLADVTPMSANPPIGTPLTSQEQTFTVIDNFYQPTGGSLFTYLDSGNSPLNLPISDPESIKAIQVNLASSLTGGNTESVQVEVSLRNRKTNL